MGIEFDWEINEAKGDDQHEKHRATAPWKRWGVSLLVFLVIAAIGAGIWWQFYSAERKLRRSVQSLLDLQQSAFQEGDGELFYATLSDDTFWESVQLRPEIQAINAAGLSVSHAEQHNGIIWANLVWQAEGEERQRIAFFEESDTGLTHIENDPNFWGGRRLYEHSWGQLRLLEADDSWKGVIATQIEQTINGLNINGDLAIPFEALNVEIRNDFADSISAETLYFPSPRLLGMAGNDGPDSRYFDGLKAAIAAHLKPVVIRHALPATDPIYGAGRTIYEEIAERFEAQFAPGQVQIDLIFADGLRNSPEQWLPTVDAAELMPTQALLQSGHVYDLSWFVAGDRGLNIGDYSAQAWAAGWWDNRPWMIPWSSGVNIVYIDKIAFRDLGLPVPTDGASWEDVLPLLAQVQAQSDGKYGLLDPARDLVYAYALSLDAACIGEPGCQPSLKPEHVEAALRWYQQIAVEEPAILDLSHFDAAQRFEQFNRALGVQKQAAIWIDSPVRWESQIAFRSVGVMPFLPFSAETPLVMPMHVTGNVMSAHTDSAWWTWQWLKFLSHQPSPNGLRNIPARPSLAIQTGFWGWLPEPVAGLMRDVVPTARSLRIGDERHLSWEQLAAARDGDIDGATQPLDVLWFMSGLRK